MGERRINQKFNVHEKYREVNIQNPYRFSVSGGCSATPESISFYGNIISRYTFDDDNGDDVVGANDLTSVDILYEDEGVCRSAIYDGITSVLYSESSDWLIGNTDKFSFSCLFKVSAMPAARYALSRIQRGVSAGVHDKDLIIYSDGSVGFYVFSGGAKYATSASGLVVVDTLYHIVGLFDGTNIIVYLDGVNVASLAVSGSFLNTITPRLVLGGVDVGFSVTRYDGDQDEMIVWDRDLTPSEVSDLSTIQLSGKRITS